MKTRLHTRALCAGLALALLVVFTGCMGSEPADYNDPNLNVDSLHKVYQFKYYRQLGLDEKLAQSAQSFIAEKGGNLDEIADYAAKLTKFGTLIDKEYRGQKGGEQIGAYLLAMGDFYTKITAFAADPAAGAKVVEAIDKATQAYDAIGDTDEIFNNVVVGVSTLRSGLPYAMYNTVAHKADNDAPDDMVITLAGNTMLGNPINNWDTGYNEMFQRKEQDPYFPLLYCLPFFSNDELSALTYEGLLTNAEPRVEDGLKGFPEYAYALRYGGIEVASLATEHLTDFYEVGVTETKDQLFTSGVYPFYDGESAGVDTKLGKVKFLSYEVTDEKNIRLILRDEIEQARKEHAVVVVNFHWGKIDSSEVSEYQKKYAKMAVDYGADIVMGSHPYAMQGIEYYKGKPIVYSMGNLTHGADQNNEYPYGFLMRVRVKKTGEALDFTDFEIVPYEVSTGNVEGFMPRPLRGEKAKEVVARVRTLSDQLESPPAEIKAAQ